MTSAAVPNRSGSPLPHVRVEEGEKNEEEDGYGAHGVDYIANAVNPV